MKNLQGRKLAALLGGSAVAALVIIAAVNVESPARVDLSTIGAGSSSEFESTVEMNGLDKYNQDGIPLATPATESFPDDWDAKTGNPNLSLTVPDAVISHSENSAGALTCQSIPEIGDSPADLTLPIALLTGPSRLEWVDIDPNKTYALSGNVILIRGGTAQNCAEYYVVADNVTAK